VQQVGSLVYGPPSIIPQRVQMELAFLNATLIDLNPAGITNRWINYTAHPSQTPGVGQTSTAFAPSTWSGQGLEPRVFCNLIMFFSAVQMQRCSLYAGGGVWIGL